MTFIFISSTTTTAFSSTKVSVYKNGTVDSAAEQDFLNRTNALRASLGLGALKVNGELLTKARNWSQTQADSGTIFHSTLTNGVTQNWHRLGENVGMGPDVASIHDALVRSPRHYENLADPGFTDVGIGVVRQGDVIYVTQVFMELMPVNSQPATTPAKSTPSKAPANASSALPAQPVAEAAPLKTASEELSAIVKKISALEA
ncbi:MAG: CAP domain-containing protein [Acidimicrobiia bacterium]